jgi:hypothetical protein
MLSPVLTEYWFPAGGLTLAEAEQALTNIQFLLVEALSPDGLFTMNDCAATNTGHSLFIMGIDQMLGVLGFEVTKHEWLVHVKCHTALLLEVFQELFILGCLRSLRSYSFILCAGLMHTWHACLS